MFDFFVRKGMVQGAQRFIDRLTPKVQVDKSLGPLDHGALGIQAWYALAFAGFGLRNRCMLGVAPLNI